MATDKTYQVKIFETEDDVMAVARREENVFEVHLDKINLSPLDIINPNLIVKKLKIEMDTLKYAN